MTPDEHLRVPYTMIIASVRRPDGVWVRRAEYPELPGCVADQDRAMAEGMGRIVDRTDEHLGTTDIAVITARRRLIRMARELQEGVEPYAAHHGALYRVRSAVTTSPEADFHRLLASLADLLVAT